jgi:hypothetical protein
VTPSLSDRRRASPGRASGPRPADGRFRHAQVDPAAGGRARFPLWFEAAELNLRAGEGRAARFSG